MNVKFISKAKIRKAMEEMSNSHYQMQQKICFQC